MRFPRGLECHKICLGFGRRDETVSQIEGVGGGVRGEGRGGVGQSFCNPYHLWRRARELFKELFVALLSDGPRRDGTRAVGPIVHFQLRGGRLKIGEL